MKKLLIILIALGLLLVVVSVAQAQDPFFIWLGPDLDGQTFVVPPGYTPNIYLAWFACSRGLVNNWMNNLNIELTLEDGTLLHRLSDKHDPYWWDIFEYEEPPMEGCIPASPTYAIVWDYTASLDPGVYEISFHLWTVHQTTDAYDTNFDGVPDFYNADRGGTFTLIIQ